MDIKIKEHIVICLNEKDLETIKELKNIIHRPENYTNKEFEFEYKENE